MKKKTIIPNDFRDFLSIISFAGFLGIALLYIFDISFLADNGTGIIMLLGGLSFLVVGKVFTINKWLNDGIQKNEVTLIMTIVLGISSVIIGVLLLSGYVLPESTYMFVGVIALIPAVYTLLDYYAKNTKGFK